MDFMEQEWENVGFYGTNMGNMGISMEKHREKEDLKETLKRKMGSNGNKHGIVVDENGNFIQCQYIVGQLLK
jgi:hypothetical protein